MRGLHEYQRQLAAAILNPGPAAAEFPIPAAMAIHRNTVLSVLTRALSLSFPTIVGLTGPDYFQQLVTGFVKEYPPRSAVLYEYGGELPDFLASFQGAADYPYFRDTARFDWLIDQTSHHHPHRYRPTLTYFDYAVDVIRDAVTGETDEVLQNLDVGPNPRWLGVWNSDRGVLVTPFSHTVWREVQHL
jgi:hypothetical protein